MYKESIGPYSFEVGMYRPPSEGGSYSLLLRFTRNCPWNKCTFCGMYKQEKFSIRSVDEIKGDISSIAGLCLEMQDISRDLGHGGVTLDPLAGTASTGLVGDNSVPQTDGLQVLDEGAQEIHALLPPQG